MVFHVCNVSGRVSESRFQKPCVLLLDPTGNRGHKIYAVCFLVHIVLCEFRGDRFSFEDIFHCATASILDEGIGNEL